MENHNLTNADIIFEKPDLQDKLCNRLIITGILTVLLGFSAILLPIIATLTIQAILSAVLIIACITHLMHAFQSPHSKKSFTRFIAGIVYGVTGGILLFFPLTGALTLTILLAILFMTVGVVKVSHSLLLKPLPGWGWVMLNGIFSILLGFVIWFALPNAAGWAIGLIVGVELLFSGWTMTLFGILSKKT